MGSRRRPRARARSAHTRVLAPYPPAAAGAPAPSSPVGAQGAPSYAEPAKAGSPDGERDPIRRTIEVGSGPAPLENPERAATTVTRDELEERQPQSSPDALRYEPGVYLQQTAHGQGSPYIRGLTGQQLAYLFDGIRLNNSVYRQGPNQYLFTVDVRTIDHYEVVRGPASVRYGSDALGGAILATPVRPTLVAGERPWEVHPRANPQDRDG